MKYLKTYTLYERVSKETNKVFESDKSFREVNIGILNSIDVLTSFSEDLQELGFVEGFSDKRPIQVYARCSGQRYNLIDFTKYVNENLDKDISTIEWSISGDAKNIDDKEFDLAVEEFVNKLTDFSPNCRINNLKKEFHKTHNMIYTKGKYDKSDRCDAKIGVNLLDNKKTRYFDETSKDIQSL